MSLLAVSVDTMPISLLELYSGHLSLEFRESDIPAVKKSIEQLFGEIAQIQYVMVSEIKFGGASFTFQNEWNTPCLVSGSAEGDECLRQIHLELKRP